MALIRLSKMEGRDLGIERAKLVQRFGDVCVPFRIPDNCAVAGLTNLPEGSIELRNAHTNLLNIRSTIARAQPGFSPR